MKTLTLEQVKVAGLAATCSQVALGKGVVQGLRDGTVLLDDLAFPLPADGWWHLLGCDCKFCHEIVAP